MPAKKSKKIVKKLKRIRPKFTLGGVNKDAARQNQDPEKVEDKKESGIDLTPIDEVKPAESPIEITSQLPTPEKSESQVVQPPQTQFSPAPPPSQYMVTNATIDGATTPTPASSADTSSDVSTTAQSTPEKPIIESVSVKKKRSWVFPIVLLVIFILGLGCGIFYFFFINKDGSFPFWPANKTTVERKTPAVSISPTGLESEPTPKEASKSAINLAEYTIALRNGSGISGEAGKVKALLEKAGFIVGSVGNASKYDYEETVIEVSKGVKKAFVDKLISILSKSYVVASDTSTLDGATEDAIVIVGSKKVE